MKELSIEEKAKAYDDLLVRLKKAKVDNDVCDERYCCVIDDIVPELKESEDERDERIRKWLINFVQGLPDEGLDFHFYNLNKEQVIAWLEKQGEQKSAERKDFISIPFGAFDSELVNETITIPDGCVATIEGNKIHIKREGKSATEAIKEEKVDNANKVESSFKIGDWVSIGRHDILIGDIRNDLYEGIFTNGEHRVFDINVLDKEAHLWTITDAKDGDIIYATSKFNTFDFIYIFSEIKNENPWAYCSVERDCDDLDGDSKHWYFDNCKGSTELERYDFYPATKEQRDILFTKMKEEGYTWDSEKKELKDNGEK